ncbi:MAG TPA: CvpA family protein [Terracidiphilus sp.]|nr:CvpA family protein [Terracidiphilus sp.]
MAGGDKDGAAWAQTPGTATFEPERHFLKCRRMGRIMTWVDWAIVFGVLMSVLAGLFQGFFRTACSLVGLLFGLSLAAWNYGHVAAVLMPMVRIEAVADTIAFFLIAILVLALANLVGNLLGKALDWMGLGCLDMLGGAVLGFFQGVLLVTLCILVTVAFFPQAQWLTESRLPRQFFGACHISTHVTPAELAERVRQGLRTLELESPKWMHPNNGG